MYDGCRWMDPKKGEGGEAIWPYIHHNVGLIIFVAAVAVPSPNAVPGVFPFLDIWIHLTNMKMIIKAGKKKKKR